MLYTFIFLVVWNFVNKYAIVFLHTGVKQQIEYTHTHTHTFFLHSVLLLVVYNCKQYQHLFNESKLKNGPKYFFCQKGTKYSITHKILKPGFIV